MSYTTQKQLLKTDEVLVGIRNIEEDLEYTCATGRLFCGGTHDGWLFLKQELGNCCSRSDSVVDLSLSLA